jgi:hypothetical protein
MTETPTPEVVDARPKRLTLSQIVEMLLTRSSPKASSVTLTRKATGETEIEVKVTTDEDGGIATVEDAERKAQDVYDRLRTAYSEARHDNASVELTRNARGETQIDVQIRAADGTSIATADDAREKASEMFRDLRARFPLSSGAVAKTPDGAE